jgi:hypothetical protein
MLVPVSHHTTRSMGARIKLLKRVRYVPITKNNSLLPVPVRTGTSYESILSRVWVVVVHKQGCGSGSVPVLGIRIQGQENKEISVEKWTF